MKKIILGVAMLAAQLSFAQENKQDKTIDEVTILGRKKIKQERKEFTRHAQSTETLSEEELNRNNSAMIDQNPSILPKALSHHVEPLPGGVPPLPGLMVLEEAKKKPQMYPYIKYQN